MTASWPLLTDKREQKSVTQHYQSLQTMTSAASRHQLLATCHLIRQSLMSAAARTSRRAVISPTFLRRIFMPRTVACLSAEHRSASSTTGARSRSTVTAPAAAYCYQDSWLRIIYVYTFASSVDEFMSAACRGGRSDELTKTFGAFLVQLYFTLMKPEQSMLRV